MKLKFFEDKFYDGKLVFEAHKVYDVETDNGWADRWIKRGAIVVEQVIEEKIENQESKFEGSKKKHYKNKFSSEN